MARIQDNAALTVARTTPATPNQPPPSISAGAPTGVAGRDAVEHQRADGAPGRRDGEGSRKGVGFGEAYEVMDWICGGVGVREGGVEGG